MAGTARPGRVPMGGGGRVHRSLVSLAAALVLGSMLAAPARADVVSFTHPSPITVSSRRRAAVAFRRIADPLGEVPPHQPRVGVAVDQQQEFPGVRGPTARRCPPSPGRLRTGRGISMSSTTGARTPAPSPAAGRSRSTSTHAPRLPRRRAPARQASGRGARRPASGGSAGTSGGSAAGARRRGGERACAGPAGFPSARRAAKPADPPAPSG